MSIICILQQHTAGRRVYNIGAENWRRVDYYYTRAHSLTHTPYKQQNAAAELVLCWLRLSIKSVHYLAIEIFETTRQGRGEVINRLFKLLDRSLSGAIENEREKKNEY